MSSPKSDIQHVISAPVVHREHHRDVDDDRPRLECGVCGVWGAAQDEASSIVALGLHALQHRGQEACGIASVNDTRFHTERHMGHVGEAFGGTDLKTRMPGAAAVGHTRYSTAGGSFLRNIQPMFADLDQGGIAIGHNGNLTNFHYLRNQLVGEGSIFQSTSDSEVILHLIARSRKAKIVDRFIDALARIEGGYALVAQTLAREFPIDADVVVPVPDSGVPAALGYAQESGIPYEMGIIRSHYLGRTFIQPSQGARQKGVRMKHSPNKSALAGKRVVLIDDSIVRGTTSLKLVRAVRAAGATEVHLRSASPQILFPDFYGIDMPERAQLLAANKTLEEMRDLLEVDSLGFLSIDGLYQAMGETGRNNAAPQFTDHYFTGDYPTRLLDREIEEGGREFGAKQLSLLVSA